MNDIMNDIINLLPNKHALNEMALAGKAFGGDECFKRQVVDAVYSAEELPGKALEFAATMAEKDRVTYTQIKHGLRKAILVHR